MQDVKDAGYPVITALPIPAAMPEQNIDEMMKGLRNTRSNFNGFRQWYSTTSRHGWTTRTAKAGYNA
jgi:hypothetical protein